MELLNFKKEDNKEKNYINKGKRVFPDLKTAIFANLKGFVNGVYPEPLPESVSSLGYYPLSMASKEELEQINIIEQKVLGGKN